MPKNPLCEVFGFPIDNLGPEATRYRKNQLCPFGNRVPNCTKDKANNPLGVCSILSDDERVITCPVRFRQDWIIAEHSANFFFEQDTKWTTLTEVSLKEKNGKSAGNIDVVVVAYDERGDVIDFGALEIQAVYISGNVRNPFEHYIEDPPNRKDMNWSNEPNYPRPDYLSSSRKRLVPQLIFKGSILNKWKKKTAVALNKGFFSTLPKLKEVDAKDAEMAWFIYDLIHNADKNVNELTLVQTVYTGFNDPLNKITTPEPGDINEFKEILQTKITEKLDNINPPDTETIKSPI